MTRRGYPVSFVLFVLGVVFTVFYFIQTFIVDKAKVDINLSVLGLLLVISVLSAIGNSTLFQAANDAPNPGLVSAIAVGIQSAVITVLAVVFFKDKISFLQIIGLVLGIISVFLISFGSLQKTSTKLPTEEKSNTSLE